ncbi:MAG TPA: hypothetical protein EYO33_07280 [Phycisphaerales bacterium]|nr:hypothetical protein [Phycisphaerales bacterium]
MISRAGLTPKHSRVYVPGESGYDSAMKYSVEGTAHALATIKDTFLAEDNLPHDGNAAKGEVSLNSQPLDLFLGFGGMEGRGLYTGEATPDSFSYQYTPDDDTGAGTWFGAMEKAEDGTVTMLRARHYGVQDNEPDFTLITAKPNGPITVESGVPTGDFHPVMDTRGTEPYYGEVGG